jgi:hypothetical protein
MSDEQRKICTQHDDCKEILQKLGYLKREDYNKTFRYNKMLLTLEKFKKSDKIFLSKSGDNNFYKIAFVYDNKEYFPFEIGIGGYSLSAIEKMIWQIANHNCHFESLNEESPEEKGTTAFSLVTTKHGAKKLLANCEKQNYADGVLDFINTLLT